AAGADDLQFIPNDIANQCAINENMRVYARRPPHGPPSKVLKLLVRKLIQGALMIAVVSAATFALLSSAGGDALAGMYENPQVSQETIDRMRAVYGLDRPVAERYAGWLAKA